MGLFSRSKSKQTSDQVQRTLIVAGPPCSGCALTASLLNHHPRVALSYERFGQNSASAITEIGTNPDQSPSANWSNEDVHRCTAHFDDAEVIGDSSPAHERNLGPLAAQLPNARILGINRNVYDLAHAYESRKASDAYPDWQLGYQQAVQDWNRAQVSLLDISRTQPDKTLIISYERLFSYSPIYLQNILKFLEIGAESPQIKNGYEKICSDWMQRFSDIKISSEMDKFIKENANFEAYQLAIEFGEKSFF